MKVLVISNFYPPDAVGGYELVCEGVVDALADDGHDVVVLTGKGEGQTGQPHVHRVLNRHLKAGSPVARAHPLRRLRSEIEDHRSLRAQEPWDLALVFHMHGLSKSLLTALHARGRVGYVLGDIWPGWDLLTDPWLGRIHPAGPPGTPAEGLKRFRRRDPLAVAAIPLARRLGVPTEWPDLYAEGHWWANSRWTLEVLTERRGLPLRNTKVIHHGIPLQDFPLRKESEPGRRLLCVGRMTEAKGTTVAIEAVQMVPGASLTLVGTADPGILEGLPPAVTAAAPVPRKDLARVYADHDVFLFPVVWDEPLGMAPLEAMAVGVPVIATGTGGSSEFLRDGENCVLVTPGDARSLAATATRVLDDAELRDRLVAAGRETARRFSFERTAKAIVESARQLNRGD